MIAGVLILVVRDLHIPSHSSTKLDESTLLLDSHVIPDSGFQNEGISLCRSPRDKTNATAGSFASLQHALYTRPTVQHPVGYLEIRHRQEQSARPR